MICSKRFFKALLFVFLVSSLTESISFGQTQINATALPGSPSQIRNLPVIFSASVPSGTCTIGISPNVTYTIPNPPIEYTCGNGAIGASGIYVPIGSGSVTAVAGAVNGNADAVVINGAGADGIVQATGGGTATQPASYAAVANSWVDSFVAGIPHYSQPSFTSISGMLALAQIPAPMGNAIASGSTFSTISIANNTQYAQNASGSSLDAQISDAVTKLSSFGGTVYGVPGNQSWLACPTWGASRINYVHDVGTTTLSVSCVVPSNVSISGAGKFDTQLHATTTGTTTGANATTITVASGTGIQNGDGISIVGGNTPWAWHTVVTAGGGTTTLTVSPAIPTHVTSVAVTAYPILTFVGSSNYGIFVPMFPSSLTGGEGSIQFKNQTVWAGWFNIDPNNFVDSAPGIRNAVASLQSGGLLRVSNGLYKISSRVDVGLPVRIEGDQTSTTTFACAGTCFTFAYAYGAQNPIRAGLSYLSFSQASNVGSAIYVGGDPASGVTPSSYYFFDSGFQYINIQGFSTGINFGSNTFLDAFDHLSIWFCVNGLNVASTPTNSGENITFTHSDVHQNTFGVLSALGPNWTWNFEHSSFDFNTSRAINSSGQLVLNCNSCWFEDNNSTASDFIFSQLGSNVITLNETQFRKDNTSGTDTELIKLVGGSNRVTFVGGQVDVNHPVTQMVTLNTPGTSQILNNGMRLYLALSNDPLSNVTVGPSPLIYARISDLNRTTNTANVLPVNIPSQLGGTFAYASGTSPSGTGSCGVIATPPTPIITNAYLATGTIPVTSGSLTGAAITLVNLGNGYTALPTTWTLVPGSISCSGNITTTGGTLNTVGQYRISVNTASDSTICTNATTVNWTNKAGSQTNTVIAAVAASGQGIVDIDPTGGLVTLTNTIAGSCVGGTGFDTRANAEGFQ